MFTGLIEETGTVASVTLSGSGYLINVTASAVLSGVKTGDSIAINGACQTVTAFTDSSFTVFASRVTAEVTTLAGFTRGTKVNLERALTPLSRMGGHIVQGHIDGKGIIDRIMRDESGVRISVSAGASIMKYIAEKGSVAIDGISLTVVSENGRSFDLYIIPETMTKTTIPLMKAGDSINIETDVIAKYVEKFTLGGRDEQLMRKLAENGFM